ncbi:unnamed protein product [Rotaria sp. Silwood1]|nr:unnamed protein product [Rotaria sp. Silwood1]CAF1617088.1 unnamed protein product [Rotaria sp. Silwood1]
MKQIKRRRNNIIHDNNENKKKKIDVTVNETNCLIKENITTLENLSNELIYEIFEFLNNHHAFQAFYDLNQRFQNLFLNSNLLIKINISSIPKSKLQHYLTHIIKPYAYRIELFRLSNPFIDPCLLLLLIMKNLTQVTTLILNNIESIYIEQIVNNLSSLPVLSSLTIISIDTIQNHKNIIYNKIFRLPKLKYCQILIELLQYSKSLSVATNEFSTVEHLIINHEISIDQLLILLSYVPQLRRLSIGNLKEPKINRTEKGSINLNYLTNVSLKLNNVNFNDFEILVTNYFRQIQVLTIALQCIGFYGNSIQYLNADRWEQLISTHMLNLRIFDFQLSYRILDSNRERQEFETLINKFNSTFWIEHQWFFDHHYHQMTWSNTAIFCSRNPYRKDYVLYDGLIQNMWSSRFDINEDPIHHICIHSTNMIKKSIDNFPNATKLTFCETFEVSRDLIAMDLNRFLPLQQLTKLTIECHHFSFEQLIELLQFTPNVHVLKLDSILLYRTNSLSIQQNDLSKLVSKINTITKVTISKEITLEKIQLFTTVFPRIEYLTINLYKEDLQPIARFLLSKSHNNTRYLSSLCISKQRNDLMIILENLIKSKKLLRDYTLKVINRKLYLWW